MLAYAFWHWPRSDVASEVYQSHQRAFQGALAQHPPIGFLSATTVRLHGAPWAADGGEAYEDWYLIGGMPDLERLNEAAVTAARKLPHDAIAALAGGGTAGLYRLEQGAPLAAPAVATWFGKPAGMSYPNHFERLESLVAAAGAALWMRQMVLGPTPEFCLHSTRPLVLPPEYSSRSYTCELVWPVDPPLA